MAASIKPSPGVKPDKLMHSALCLALHRAAVDADGQPTKKLALVAAKLVEVAIDGDIPAIKEIFDRVDGKVPQTTRLTGADDGPIEIEDNRESLAVILARALASTREVRE